MIVLELRFFCDYLERSICHARIWIDRERSGLVIWSGIVVHVSRTVGFVLLSVVFFLVKG